MEAESARILITGTDLVGISTYAKLLETEGYRVFTAFNGADLLDVLSKEDFNFNLIITDVKIPGLSSYELGDYIAMNCGNDIPVIGMAEFPRDEELLMESGESFAMIIEKGFTADELLEAVYSIVTIDHSAGEGMSEQQIRNRAAQLSDAKTVPISKEEYLDAAQNYVQNKGHKALIDQFKDL